MVGRTGPGRGCLTQGTGVQQLAQDVDNLTRPIAESLENWLRGTTVGAALFDSGVLIGVRATDMLRMQREGTLYGPFGLNPAELAAGQRQMTSNTINVPVAVTVNVNAAAPGTIAQVVGEAAGNAVGSALRSRLSDTHWPY